MNETRPGSDGSAPVSSQAQAPIAALRREREKRKAEQIRAEGLERELQAMRDAWAAERSARDSVVNAALSSSDDPHDDAFRAHGDETTPSDPRPEDLAALRHRRVHPAVIPPQPAPAPPVPRSLATASGAGGAAAPRAPVGPGQAFAAAIPR